MSGRTGGLRTWCAVLLTFACALPAVSADAAARPEVVPAKRLFMVSDSVGLGAIPAMSHAFAGWQVTVTGKPGLFTELLVKYVTAAPAGAFGDNAIVATGYNYPYWDPPRFDRSVDQMVAALKARGVKRIFWVTMREVKPEYYSHWSTLTAPYRTLYLAYPHTNDQLRAATKRHPELSIIDWASISDQNGLTYDAIHLNPTGAAQYAGLAFTTVTTGVTRRPAGTVTQVPLAGRRGVPLDATGVSVQVTAVNPRTAGAVTVYPCGTTPPTVGTLITTPARTSSNTAIVHLGTGGAVCVRQSVDSHVLVDLNGAFAAGSGLTTVRTRRLLDTRKGAMPAAGSVRAVALGGAGAPAAPFTAVVNVGTIAAADGQVRVFTCGTAPPPAPVFSFTRGRNEFVTQVVRTDAAGRVCVATTGGAHVSVDLDGWFSPATGVRAVRARRVLDTRAAGGALVRGVARTVQIGGAGGVPAGATGVMVTVSLTGPAAAGVATVYPCASGASATTAVTVLPHHGAANAVLVGLDTAGRMCIRSTVSAQVTLDLSAYTTTALVALRPVRVVDTRA